MTKLKTLKDLKEEYIEASKEQVKIVPEIKRMIDGVLVFEDRLKQEAIKWVKAILETDEETLKEALSRNTRVSWIVHFFNITEEDLK